MRRILLAALTACGTPQPSEQTVTQLASVCVDGDELLATFIGCLSSSCDTLVQVHCTATLAGDVVDVEGAALVRSVGDECTADCGLIQARCLVPAGADPRTTLLTFGGDTGGPTLEDAACTGW